MNGRGDVARPLGISVLSQIDPASPRTNSISDFRLCWGLATAGHDVELVVPDTTATKPSSNELFATYELEPNFEVRYVSASYSGDLRTSLSLLREHGRDAVRRTRAPVVISRDAKLLLPYLVAARVSARPVLTAPWVHEFRGKRLERLVCSNASCILATNPAILEDLHRQGISKPATFVTGNAVPRERVEFGRTFSKREARRRLGLDQKRPVIAYTGKLYLGMRELDYLLTAACRLPDCLFLFTGGQPPVIRQLREQLHKSGTTNISLTGILAKPEETRFYQQAADVLVSYYSIEDHSHPHHNLPNKLAEYMTTGNPIVASDFAAVRHLLRGDNAILVKPDDVDALTEALRFAVRNPSESASLAARAQDDIAAGTTESVGADLSTFLAQQASLARGKRA